MKLIHVFFQVQGFVHIVNIIRDIKFENSEFYFNFHKILVFLRVSVKHVCM